MNSQQIFSIIWFPRSAEIVFLFDRSLNDLCLSSHFSSSRKAIHSFVSFYSHFHSLTHATRSLYYIWFRKKGIYSSVDRFILIHSHFCHFRFLSVWSIRWSMWLDLNSIFVNEIAHQLNRCNWIWYKFRFI